MDFKKCPKTDFPDVKTLRKERARQEIEALEKAEPGEVETVEDIGSATAQSLYNFFRQDETRNALRQLHKAGVEVEPRPARKHQDDR